MVHLDCSCTIQCCAEMGNSETKLVFAEMLLPTSSAQQLYAVYDDTYVASTTLLNIYANAAPHS